MATKRRKKILPRLKRLVAHSLFQRVYVIGSLVVLGLTTIFWALLGSLTQAGNADQLANSYMTENATTFQGAILPDQHTFLFKLPFFWLVQLLGGTPVAFSIVTILVVCLTVGLFAFILYKIQPRPLIIGTLYVLLALVLVMIPAEPYAGSLLPTNMAMLTTRNLEYVLFFGIILLIVQAKRWYSGYLWLALLGMILLVASDKLFLSLGIGGAFLLAVISIIRRQAQLRTVSLRWLVISVTGSVGALLLMKLLVMSGFIHVDGQSVTGPYGLVHSLKDFVLALFYGVLGIFTNFGANPGFDSRTVVGFPAIVAHRLASPFVAAYIGTIAIAIAALATMWIHIKTGFKKHSKRSNPLRHSYVAALMLIATSVVAAGVFVVSNHYYPVDSRYLTIFLFAGFMSLTVFTFKKKWSSIGLVVTGIIAVLMIVPAVFWAFQGLQAHQTANRDIEDRNNSITKVLQLHPVKALLGDYWRVLPIKSVSTSPLTVTPLSDCTTGRSILTSRAWQTNLTNDSFAYLLTIGPGSATFPSCTLAAVTDVYGRPDSSVVISGTTQDPKEIVLFYDKGIRKVRGTVQAPPDTVIPAPLSALPNTTCDQQTIMQFVAHEDDDILFMNPDLYRDIQAGNCIRTVFVTAGDAGLDKPYWLGRQRGAEAAYASMLGLTDTPWTERIIEMSPKHFAIVANPRGNHKISLIFLRLPDGNMSGSGFNDSQNQSLKKLYDNHISTLPSVDRSSTYSSTDLSDAFIALMGVYHPNQIRSQSADVGKKYLDHSDHTAVAKYVAKSAASYIASRPLVMPTVSYYLGYPVHGFSENVTGADLDMKVKTFLAFGKFDTATCHSFQECDHSSIYGIYLRRQYTSPY